jgi:pimeloyl-ACP methyl ester carboxylesterase
VLGHSYGGVCALEAALLTDRIARLVLYEAPVGFVQTPPHVVDRLQALLEADERDELLALFMREVAALPREQIEVLRSLPAWEARLAAAHTIPREERANRRYAFYADRFRALHVPTLLLEGGESPDAFRAAGEALQAALPDCRIAVMPGQRHAAMDTGTEVFVAQILSFLEPSRLP